MTNGSTASADSDRRAAELRRRLASYLADAGYVRSPEWRAAIEAVPRHVFLPAFFTTDTPPDGSPTTFVPVTAEECGVDRWLDLTYTDETYVTQLDGDLTPTDLGPGETRTNCTPTSSSSLPSLVLAMWEDLDVADGHQVLEIGTGAGYSTAIGCHRLGDDNVTSIEVDPVVAARARAALDRVGYHPRLVVGDGLLGHVDRAPYDRVIATCGLRNIPLAWLDQCRPGAVILVTLSGWLDATGLAKLTVTAAGAAEGAFINPNVSFMPARAHAPEFVLIPKIDQENLISERLTTVGPEILADWGTVRHVIQLAAPNAQYLQLDATQDMSDHLFVTSDDSYVTFDETPSGWLVRQGGRQALWDRVEMAVAAWRRAGEPPLTQFRIKVASRRQTISFDSEHAWELPGLPDDAENS